MQFESEKKKHQFCKQCDDITGVFTAPAIDALSGKEVTGSSWVENVISSIPKIITLFLGEYVGEVSQVI